MYHRRKLATPTDQVLERSPLLQAGAVGSSGPFCKYAPPSLHFPARNFDITLANARSETSVRRTVASSRKRMPTRKGHTDLMRPSRERRRVRTTNSREMLVNDLVGCRDRDLLCRRRAALDTQHSWKWLGEAERWRVPAHREIALVFKQWVWVRWSWAQKRSRRLPKLSPAGL